MDILWMIGLYLVCGFVVLLVLSRIDNYFINKASKDYRYDGILISVHSKWLAIVIIVFAILTWPITYTVSEIRIMVKYLKAKKEWKKEMEYQKTIEELYKKWSA